MIRPRRGGPPAGRYLLARVGLFFLGALVWLGGVVAGDRRVTGGAIAILAVAMLLGFLDRGAPPDGHDEPSE